MTEPLLELVCPAGTPAALRAAIDAGDETNARNFPGLNFDRAEFADDIAYAHDAGRHVYLAVNTYPEAGNPGPLTRAIDDASSLGVDTVIVAGIGLLDYARRNHPEHQMNLLVKGSASNTEAIAFYHRAFGGKRVVLHRLLDITEIAALKQRIPVETGVFAFGGTCVMAEGHCSLSSHITGQPCTL